MPRYCCRVQFINDQGTRGEIKCFISSTDLGLIGVCSTINHRMEIASLLRPGIEADYSHKHCLFIYFYLFKHQRQRNESEPIQLAQCRFPWVAISNAKI